jgi:DNA-directed RNA polymerase
MREIIRRMGSENDELDFWAVHDSFGTHASEIDKLREIVTSSFHKFYQCSNINSLGGEISENYWSEVKLGDFDIEEILKSEYMIS